MVLIVLRFYGPLIRVISSAVSLPNLAFLGQAQLPKQLTSTCAHSFVRNRQLPFLNQRKREKMLPDPAGFEPATS